MHLMYFTEQPMAAYDAQEGLKYGATALTFSNKHYNSMEGSRLYNEYLEEYILAEECGESCGDLALRDGRDFRTLAERLRVGAEEHHPDIF